MFSSRQFLIILLGAGLVAWSNFTMPKFAQADDLAKIYAKLDKAEIYVIEAVNKLRKENGVKPLEIDLKLCRAARDHSSDMRTLNFFSHDSPIEGKAEFTDRAKRFDTTASAENIGKGSAADKVMKLWIQSEQHKENMLDGKYTRIGVGRSGKYYTQMFGRP